MEQKPISNHVFVQIIKNMKEQGYIEGQEAEKLTDTYSNYINGINEKYKENSEKEKAQIASAGSARVPVQPVYQPVKTVTKEEIRERNLSWILNIGVALILLSGLVFGTTTWELMNNISKAVLLFCVSLLFFGVSSLAKSALKIERTSNAFWVMGSLMLPVSLFSIGFFQLLGEYFSIFGEGRYLFGIAATLICLPVYIWGTYKYKSRTFSWITLIGVSLLWAFTVLSFYPKTEILFLLLLAFNGLFLALKYFAANSKRLAPFSGEASVFIQLNLILTTAITLFTYNNTYMFSVNIILASMLFFALSITEKTKEYDYIFGLLFSGGMFLFTKDFNNDLILFLGIASIGYIFAGIAFLANENTQKSARFNVLSGIVAILSFIFIAFNISFMTGKETIIAGLLSLAVIIVNYLYLHHRTKIQLFGIVIPVKLMLLFHLSGVLLANYYNFNYFPEYMLSLIIVLYVVGFALNKLKGYEYLKYSSAVVSMISTVFLFIYCIFISPQIFTLPVIGLVFTAQLFVFGKLTAKGKGIGIVNYIIPGTLTLSLCLIRYSYSLFDTPELAFYFFCAFFTYLLHFAAIKKISEFKKPLFYIGQAIMTLIYIATLIIYQKEFIYTITSLLLLITYSYSVFAIKKVWARSVFLYAALLTSTLFLYNVQYQILTNYDVDISRYVVFISGFLVMAAFPLIKNALLRMHISFYLILISLIMMFGNLNIVSMLWYEYAAEIIYAGLLCLILFKIKLDNLNILPLTLVLTANYALVNIIFKNNSISFPAVAFWFMVLLFIGLYRYKNLYGNKLFDWFSIFALANVLILPYSYMDFEIAWISALFPGIMISLWFFLNRKRFGENKTKPGNILFAVSLLWPYYSLLTTIKDIPVYINELIFLPPVILTYICTKWIYKTRNSAAIFFEYAIPVFSYVILLVALLLYGSLENALILGAFGLVSLLYGYVLKIKSALFLGGGLILHSVFIETREFWFSIQWWIYLLALGTILIAVASFNEYEKNKKKEDVFIKAGKYLDKFKDWE